MFGGKKKTSHQKKKNLCSKNSEEYLGAVTRSKMIKKMSRGQQKQKRRKKKTEPKAFCSSELLKFCSCSSEDTLEIPVTDV